MRISAPEIIITALVIIAILLVTRVMRIGRNTVRGDEDTREEVMMGQFELKARGMFDFFKKVGIALVALGVLLIILSASWLRWAISSYLWSAVIIVVGIIFFLVFRRRR
jgi:hypothetical protein